MKYDNMPMGRAFIIALNEDREEDDDDMPVVDNPAIELPPAEAKYVQSMLDIVSEFGKLSDNDGNGIWVGYVPAAENTDAKIGVKCSNCAFYCTVAEGECHIIAQRVEANGMCRLAAIGDGLASRNRR